jgi:hypothetical protein
MALGAAGAELASVRVLVAGGAARFEPQEGPSGVASTPGEGRRLLEQLDPVAPLAVEACVSPLEGVAGLPVVEGAATFFSPVDELDLPTVMLDVASIAAAVLRPRVEPFPCGDPGAEGAVADQATLARDALPGLVALQAPGAPLEERVGLAQLPRGDLGFHGRSRDRGADHGQGRPQRVPQA